MPAKRPTVTDPTPLEQLLEEMHGWTGDDRSIWKLVHYMREFAPVAEPPRVPVPDWFIKAAREVVEHLARHWTQSPTFLGVRAAERLGLVTLERDDNYILAMVGALGDRTLAQPRLEAIRTDDEVREALVWRVFEVEGGGEISLANVDKFSREEAGWAEAFRILVADGTLPRERVLRCCLQALARDFSAYRAGWFSRTYRSFEPTPAELAESQAMFVDLLRSTVPATVSFAVKCLAVVDKAGLLDDDEYVAGCTPALAGATRATPIAAIALATGVVARRPDLAAAVAAVVVLGLEHPHRDVQSAALATLRALDAQGLVRDRLDLLEPSVRRLAADWLGDAQATPASPLLALPPEAFVSTVDETVAELGARILTGTGSGLDVEQFLAGLLNAADPATEVAPLTTQAKKVVTNPSTVGTLRRQNAKTVDAALGQPDPAPAVNQRAASLHGDILRGRLAEVVEILAGRRPRHVLLATPTDPAGWLNPVVFVSRLSTLDGDPPHHDLVAALLRLSIAGRDAARSAAAGITGELGDVVRYALGGPPGEIATRSWWVAAARTRAPFDDDPHVIAAGLPGAGAGTAARYTVRLVPHPYSFEERGRTRTLTWWRPWLDVAPASGTEYADQPTVVAAQEMPISTDEADWLTWAGTVWPHDPEPFFARVFYDPWDAASTYPSVTYCTTNILNVPATHPGRLGPMAAATLAAGLGGPRGWLPDPGRGRLDQPRAHPPVRGTAGRGDGRDGPALSGQPVGGRATGRRQHGTRGRDDRRRPAGPAAATAAARPQRSQWPAGDAPRGVAANRPLPGGGRTPSVAGRSEGWLEECEGGQGHPGRHGWRLVSAGLEEFTYVYRSQSTLDLTDGVDLRLATSSGAAHPYFFDGFVERADVVAAALLVVARVARTRFYTPPGMLAAILTAADPIVTSNGDRLRFESFSACCGVYCRLDVLPEGLDRPPRDTGTTNVDFNSPMRDALSGVRGLDPMHLAVGDDEVRITTLDDSAVERKVPLPPRWVKGLAEVQLASSAMTERASVSAVDVRRLLQGHR